jgi:glycosyltransferase involved in cell wall biosynthesis
VHIALITRYFPPEVAAPALGAFQHARIWTAAGHKVTVVTVAPSHPFGRVYDGYRNVTTEAEVDGIRVVRLRAFLAENAGVVMRSLSHLSFLAAATLHRSRFADADVVISVSPDLLCGLAGYPVSRRAAAPWALEIRDIWPESIVAVGVKLPSALIGALSKITDWAYRTCDLLVSLSPGFAEHFSQHGIESGKILLATNGVGEEVQGEPPALDEFPELEKLRGRFVAAYIGTLGMAHGVSTLLEAANLLRDDPSIGFVLVGAGADRDNLIKMAAALQLPNLVFLDQQPRERILRLWNQVDACIVHLKDQPLFNTVIPSKLLEGMAMGKPVLLGVRGVAKQIMEAAECGVSFEPEDAAGCAAALRALARDRPNSVRLGVRGREYVQREFNRKTIANRYLQALETLVSRRRAAK